MYILYCINLFRTKVNSIIIQFSVNKPVTMTAHNMVNTYMYKIIDPIRVLQS